jgi:excisionase family DNA binding protein
MEQLYTVEQAAEILQIHPRTLRNWLNAGRVKGRQFGRVWRIEKDDLEAFIKGQPAKEHL